ncbi:MAG: asparagine synthase (glutamine-hydrolyzing) [Oscillospiraceae bacterium]|nr:asparagine synthase (glutamine-hydrolyzing) [Oscillospiraceae bacterium]
MCGIAGFVSPHEWMREEAEAAALRMRQTLRRRGPDEEGLYMDAHAALAHARLSVMDPENGQQPMRCDHLGETYVLVYNGELYNTDELRNALIGEGFDFETHCDTEVVLKAYAAWGELCVERFNGIFAFAVWEARRKRLFLARDRIGVKPLFYAQREEGLLFGSELKALLAHPLVEPIIDAEGVAEIMLIGPGRTPGCGVFRGVKEIKPAECGYWEDGALHTRRYWRLTDRLHEQSLSQTIEQTRALVIDAMERQLISDVPLCTFLSGGLDSSLISAVAARAFKRRNQQLKTFSVDYQDNAQFFKAGKFQPSSDAPYVAEMVKAIDSEHTNVIIGVEQLVQALYDAVEAQDLPNMADVSSSMLLLCAAVKQGGTVALSGECADEIFGGYPWFTDPEIRARDGFPWAQSTAYRQGFLRPELSSMIDGEALIRERYQATIADTDALPGIDPEEKRMREMTRLNLDWFMQTLLDRKDRMSMRFGLEVRVPYCDYRIAEYLYSVPWAMKRAGDMEKGLLRAAAEGLLPDSVRLRKKSPYPKTHHPAYLRAVSERLWMLLHEADAPLWQLVRPETVRRLLSEEGRAQNWYGQLMNKPQTIAYLLQVDHWMRAYQVRLK